MPETRSLLQCPCGSSQEAETIKRFEQGEDTSKELLSSKSGNCKHGKRSLVGTLGPGECTGKGKLRAEVHELDLHPCDRLPA